MPGVDMIESKLQTSRENRTKEGRGMALHPRKKRRLQAGIPESIAVLVLIAMAATSALWVGSIFQPQWQAVQAKIATCELDRLAYSRDNIPDQVHLTYEYTVAGQTYHGRWDGFWPQAQSPNALPRQNLGRLLDKDFPLKVFYDPVHPAVNMLHYVQDIRPITYRRMFLAAIVLTVVYFIKVYPSWKMRR